MYKNNFKGKAVNDDIVEQFQAQRSRGTNGFGLYDRDFNHLVKATKERKILGWLRHHPSSEVLFHHRWPTSTSNVKSSAHPFSTKDFFSTTYILAHNGHIKNSHALHAKHKELGIVYSSLQNNGTFNDSEALLWDVALYLEGKQKELTAEGGIAFICIANNAKDPSKHRLYFARNDNPLRLLKTNEGIMVSSEGAGIPIAADQLYSFNYKTRELTQKPLEIPDGYVAPVSYSPVGYANQSHTTGPTSKRVYATDSGEYLGYWDDRYENFYKWDDTIHAYTMLTGDYPKIKSELGDYVYTPPSVTKSNYDYLDDDDDDELISLERNGLDLSTVAKEGLEFTDSPGLRRQHIRDKYNSYLKANKGKYWGAYKMATQDSVWLRDQLVIMVVDSDDDLDDNTASKDLAFEIEVLESVVDLLLCSPFWKGNNEAVEPSYAKPGEPSTADVVYAAAAQTTLLLPSGGTADVATKRPIGFVAPDANPETETVQQIITRRFLGGSRRKEGVLLT